MPGKTFLIVDTNVLLHCQPIDQIPWPTLATASDVVIVLTTTVQRELDAKKNGSSEKLKKRARRVLTAIDDWFPRGKTGEDVRIAEGVMLRLQHREPAPVPALDYNVHDDRIVGSALELRSDGDTVIVFTGDITMRVKMEAHGFDVHAISEEHRLREEEEPRRSAPRLPRLVAGFYSDDATGPQPFFAARLGLTAAHLLRDAEEELAALESPAIGSPLSQLAALNVGIMRHRPVTPDDYRRYIEAIVQYDADHARVITFTIGVSNVGDAPAEDVSAEFTFPQGLHVTHDEPRWPEQPGTRELSLDPMNLMLRHGHPRDMRRFDLDYSEGVWTARFRIARLMQTKSASKTLWATIDDESFSGFPIDACVLVGDPADNTNATLNVRILRHDESA